MQSDHDTSQKFALRSTGREGRADREQAPAAAEALGDHPEEGGGCRAHAAAHAAADPKPSAADKSPWSSAQDALGSSYGI